MSNDVPSDDFPKNLLELERWFPTEATCRLYLEGIRWPSDFECPYCGEVKFWRTKRDTFYCRQCKRQTSVTAGTIFHRTKIPLTVWFRIIWLMVAEKRGVSALSCKRQVGLKRYATVWRILQKLRLASIRPDREVLSGEVEVDEAVIGGDKLPRGLSKQRAMVIVAAECSEGGLGRIRMKAIQTRDSDLVGDFVRKNVQPGSTLITDGYRGYLGLALRGEYAHKPIPGYSIDPDKLLPRVHRVISLLKRWLLGTYHGRVRKTHLDRYLEEFVFRFNRRLSESRGKLFRRLIEQALQTVPDPISGRH